MVTPDRVHAEEVRRRTWPRGRESDPGDSAPRRFGRLTGKQAMPGSASVRSPLFIMDVGSLKACSRWLFLAGPAQGDSGNRQYMRWKFQQGSDLLDAVVAGMNPEPAGTQTQRMGRQQ